ncbi:hypothetical protein [Actinoallomurus soli]|uniref:hypothetical protein n=1 Tax=Actinoallomurus soli TaxID=2952535 RepID=UPI002092B07C|nr:hypothetical protein [Actinoallomurus soli]MCO5966917.1 hypothetical protein [Actinoallomurus soli]
MPPLNEGGTQRGVQSSPPWVGGGDPDVKWAPFKIDHAASILERALEHLSATGALDEVQTQGLLTAAELGNWDAGQTLAGTTEAAYKHISAVSRDFLTQYAAAIRLLRRTAAHYSGTEEGLAQHIRQIGGGREQPTRAQSPTWANTPSAD